MILRQDYEYKIIAGRVVSQTENGVTFDPEREGAFIEKGRSNYIGHLLLGHSPMAARDSALIPLKIGSRPKGAMAAGLLGGAIGGAL